MKIAEVIKGQTADEERCFSKEHIINTELRPLGIILYI